MRGIHVHKQKDKLLCHNYKMSCLMCTACFSLSCQRSKLHHDKLSTSQKRATQLEKGYVTCHVKQLFYGSYDTRTRTLNFNSAVCFKHWLTSLRVMPAILPWSCPFISKSSLVADMPLPPSCSVTVIVYKLANLPRDVITGFHGDDMTPLPDPTFQFRAHARNWNSGIGTGGPRT